MATKAVSDKDLGHAIRKLNVDEIKKLETEEVISNFKRDKLEREAQKNWDLFYKRNSTNFFKDRHWLTKEFPDLLQAVKESINSRRLVLLEAGCGVGNAVFPLLRESDQLFVYACDFSPRAVEFVKSNSHYSEERCFAFQCDLTVSDSLSSNIPRNSVDFVSLIFVLSAISPEKHRDVLRNIAEVLKPGGQVLMRDYGLYDHAMLRFGRGHKIEDSFYTRQDGTRAYYFSTEETEKLFIDSGYEVVENSYKKSETVNPKEGISAVRVFVQGKFSKKTVSNQLNNNISFFRLSSKIVHDFMSDTQVTSFN